MIERLLLGHPLKRDPKGKLFTSLDISYDDDGSVTISKDESSVTLTSAEFGQIYEQLERWFYQYVEQIPTIAEAERGGA